MAYVGLMVASYGMAVRAAHGLDGNYKQFPRIRMTRTALLLTSTRVVLGVLVALAAVTVGMTWHAGAAHRSHARSVERTLRGNAAVAAWQFADHMRSNLLTATYLGFLPVLSLPYSDLAMLDRMDPDVLTDAVVRTREECACLDSAVTVFHLRLQDSSLAVRPLSEAGGPVEAEVRDSVIAFVTTLQLPAPAGPLVIRQFRAAPGEPRRVAVRMPTFSNAVMTFASEGQRWTALLLLIRGEGGGISAAYGFVLPAQPLLASLSDRVLRDEELLPSELLAGLAPDSLVRVQLTTRRGDLLYRSTNLESTEHAGSQTLEARYGGMVVHVSLLPAGVRHLGGTVPRSPVPVMLALLALTLGLIFIASVQLRRQQHLVRMRAEFVSGVSHELRTPLAQIRLLAELLHREKVHEESARVRSAQVIDQEARRLTLLVDNFLNFARAERGPLTTAPLPTSLADELREIVTIFAPLAQREGASVQLHVEGDPVALVDGGALRQIVLNLLDNAVRYGPPGQTIELRASVNASCCRITVDDEGPGVPPSERSRIWEPYYRMDREATSGRPGSGIGLAVVHSLVTRHRGRARVESAPSGGARFVIELPSTAKSASHMSQTTQVPEERTG